MPDQKEALAACEAAFQSAWTGKSFSPFIADIDIDQSLLDQAISLVRDFRLGSFFANYPILGIWAVLYPLSGNYGAGTKDVYLHISLFVGESFDDPDARDLLKYQFRVAARSLGFPLQGKDESHRTEKAERHCRHADPAARYSGSAPTVSGTSHLAGSSSMLVTSMSPNSVGTPKTPIPKGPAARRASTMNMSAPGWPACAFQHIRSPRDDAARERRTVIEYAHILTEWYSCPTGRIAAPK